MTAVSDNRESGGLESGGRGTQGRPPGSRAGPLRRCLVSGAERPRGDLIRFVTDAGGQVVPDLAGRLPGRGMWVEPVHASVRRACERNLFARSARRPLRPAPGLADHVERLLEARCISLLGLARRADSLVAGLDAVTAAIRSGPVAGGVLVTAADGTDRAYRSASRLLHQPGSGVRTDMSGVRTDMSGVRTDVSGVQTDMSGVRTDMSGVRTDVSGVRTDVSGVRTDVSGVRTDVSGVRTDVSGVRTDMSWPGRPGDPGPIGRAHPARCPGTGSGVIRVTCLPASRLGPVVDRERAVHLWLAPGGLARRFAVEAARLAGMRPGGSGEVR